MKPGVSGLILIFEHDLTHPYVNTVSAFTCAITRDRFLKT